MGSGKLSFIITHKNGKFSAEIGIRYGKLSLTRNDGVMLSVRADQMDETSRNEPLSISR